MAGPRRAAPRRAIWSELDEPGGPPDGLGVVGDVDRSVPLAITQLILLLHMLAAARENRP